MDLNSILHIPMSNMAYFSSLYNLTVILRAKKDDLKEVKIIYSFKYDHYLKEKRNEEVMIKKYSDNLFDYYVFNKDVNDNRVGYIFYLSDGFTSYYFSENGFEKEYDYSKSHLSRFEYQANFEGDYLKEIKWCKDTIGYQIFPDRFNIGNYKKDLSYINLKPNQDPKSNSFGGGDLLGILNKIDYFKDLGINCLYLTPIFLSNSNHKYDTLDYFKIDPHFGDDKTFKLLVDELHRNNIKIILDGVFNHISSESKIFKDVIKNGKKSKYFNWFMINGDKVDSVNINYLCFANVKNMPRLNTSNDEVIKYITSVVTHYIKKFNIDGWRLDVSEELSFKLHRAIRSEVKKLNPNCIIIGENWRIANRYTQGDMLDSVMNYKFYEPLVHFLAYKDIDAKEFVSRLTNGFLFYTLNTNKMMMNQIENHDTHRFETLANNSNMFLIALSILIMNIGMPFLYYGSEVGLNGGYDPLCRKMFNWDEKSWDIKRLKLTKKLINFRKSNEVIKSGEIKYEYNDNLFILTRYNKDEVYKLIVNPNNEKVSLDKLNKKPIISFNFQENKFIKEGFIIIKE